MLPPMPVAPTGVATWVELQQLDAARMQAHAAWVGTVVQAVGLIAAVIAAVYAKGAYEAANRQAEIARTQYDQARRSDAAQMAHALLQWLAAGPTSRLADVQWRKTVSELDATSLARELSNHLRDHAAGQHPGDAMVYARRLGGAYLDDFTAVVHAHEQLYAARVEWGRVLGGPYVDPQGSSRDTFNASTAAGTLRASAIAFFRAVTTLEQGIGHH